MHRHSTQQQILYLNLEILKNSYKLEEPHPIPPAACHSQLKLQTTNTEASQNIGEPSTLELNCNPFSKMKHLFRRRQHNSIISDDLTNSHIFTIQPKPQPQKIPEIPPRKFQFDSFGDHEAKNTVFGLNVPQMALKEINEDVKGWNSSSFQINFEKSGHHQLKLPEWGDRYKANTINFQGNDVMENSIKQFCFKLSQDEPNLDLQLTPVKKWTQQKRNKEKSGTILTQPINIEESGRNILKKQMQDCLNVLQSAQEQNITQTVVSDTKGLLQQVKQRLMGMGIQKKLTFAERDFNTLESETESQTLRIKNDSSQLKHYQKTKENGRQVVLRSKKSGNFKIYEGKEKQVVSRSQAKVEKKPARQQTRFRF